MNANPYMIGFGIAEILLSQIPGFDQLHWLSLVAAVMSFTYSTIGLGLGIGKVIENKRVRGSLTGISIGTVTQTQKIWRSFQALGDVAFAYSYSVILIEIQVCYITFSCNISAQYTFSHLFYDLPVKLTNCLVHFMAGHGQSPTFGSQDNEESNSNKCCSDNAFLHVLWLFWICCFWRHVPWQPPHWIWLLQSILAT